MKLKKLIKDIEFKAVRGSKEIEISGVCSNSKLVAPGNVFIALAGRNYDGASYIPEAVAAGAVAVVTDLEDPLLKGITQLIHENPAALVAALAATYYQNPSKELFSIAITGTNGKTTTAFLIKHLLDSAALPCGLISTIEYIIGDHRYQASHTTPDVCSNHKMLREMLYKECQCAVMEVTSHALDQGRVAHIDFDVAVATNITSEHLDYHHTIENYVAAKKRLFTALGSSEKKNSIAVVNRDCSWHTELLSSCKATILTYGIDGTADIMAKEIVLDSHGTSFVVCYGGKKIATRMPLLGKFNVYNALAAIAVGISKGLALEGLCAAIQKLPPIPGRMQPIPNSLGISLFVDFAHTPDGLENSLEVLRSLKLGRLFVLFGCGGNRDRSKRPMMAKICEKLADYSIVTSDNPRNEAPQTIIDEIVTGFLSPANYMTKVDRRHAIACAIALTQPGDTLLIAGRGHERYQTIGNTLIDFDDSAVAAELCQQAEASNTKYQK